MNQQFSEKDPFFNLFYKRILSMNHEFQMNYLDYISLFIFILPNSLMIIISHLNDISLNFVFQNFCVLNIFVILSYRNIEIIFIGLLNLIITLTKFSADYESYSQFPYWFDLFGIEPIELI